MATIQLHYGDTSPTDPVALTKRDGTAPDGTGGSGTLLVQDWLGTQVLSSAVVNTPANPLKVVYTPQATDFAVGKLVKGVTYRARVQFTYSGGVIETFPTAPDDLLLVVL